MTATRCDHLHAHSGDPCCEHEQLHDGKWWMHCFACDEVDR